MHEASEARQHTLAWHTATASLHKTIVGTLQFTSGFGAERIGFCIVGQGRYPREQRGSGNRGGRWRDSGQVSPVPFPCKSGSLRNSKSVTWPSRGSLAALHRCVGWMGSTVPSMSSKQGNPSMSASPSRSDSTPCFPKRPAPAAIQLNDARLRATAPSTFTEAGRFKGRCRPRRGREHRQSAGRWQ